jgi:DNA-binding beta-propeller fold protein YncE
MAVQLDESASRRRPVIARGNRHRARVGRLGVAIGVLALAAGSNPVLAATGGAGRPAFGDVTVFASAPAPGHPFGIAVDNDRIYVSTSAGDFFADPANGGHRNSDGERVFAYDENGNLFDTTTIATMPDATMGLFGLALDGNPGPRHKLYVADMNGRILRVDLGQHPAAPEVFSQVPVDSGLAGDWMLSMWNDLTFDPAGNLYVPDDKPRIWRVSPDGTASIWFTDPRLTGCFGFAGGPLGGRIDPTGQWLYVSITVSAAVPPPVTPGPPCVSASSSVVPSDPVSALEGAIYRVRLVDHPTAGDLELVHRFRLVANQAPPQPTGMAFARSGNLYVSLLGPNQVAVLDPAGNEIGRISDPRFNSPWGLAFVGKSLLVTNGDLEPGDNPDAWKIFKDFVDEPGLPLIQPRASRN